ncbi:MAG: VIT family protein [Acidobacteria bacterium]|nr:MAG: VIT family protein [Acidobacteriota bacterium]
MTHHVLDPIERTSEVLFGLIMVLTLTSSIRVTEGSQADVRSVLGAAIGCNLAWGLVDAVMFVMTNFMERARNLATFRAVRQAPSAKTAQARILDSLPRVVSDVLTSAEIESLHQRLVLQADPPQDVRLTRRDFLGAVGVFLLVFLSTFPVVIPFLVLSDLSSAFQASSAVAALMLFGTGWSLGRYAGRPGWRAGLGMVAIGVGLVALTVALGG